MSNSLLANLDARMHSAFARAGLADLCEYRPKSGAAIPGVRCYVQRGIQTIEGNGSVVSNQTLVDLIRTPDLPQPLDGDVIALLDATGAVTETLTVDGAPRAADESRFQVITKKPRR